MTAALMLLIVSVTLAPVASAQAAGLAGPNQAIAEGMVVLLGDPTMSGSDLAGHSYHWRQIILSTEPYVKLSHLDAPNTMFIAPEVSRDTRFRFGVRKNSGAEDMVDITVTNLAADDFTNTTFIDGKISRETCEDYDPATRACGAGTYKAQRSTFRTAFNPPPTAGRRYVWREGTYSYSLNRGNCWPTNTPVVRIEGPNAANGTPTAPIQFKAHKNNASYEAVILDMGGTSCRITMLLWVAGSSYVIIEGFTLTGTDGSPFNTGRVLWFGGRGYGSGGASQVDAPVHHITARHIVAHDNGGGTNYRGAFYIGGPSHEVALQYVTAYNGGSGIDIGASHELDRARLPWNIFIHTALTYNNYKNSGNSSGIVFAGARNSACYRCVSHHNSDGGFNTQGPHLDTNVWWDSVSYAQDATLSGSADGNQRGQQVGTISPKFASMPPYYRAAAYNRAYNFVAYDNKGNGFNDVSGSVDGRYYNLTIFNNCLGRAYGGIALDSKAGTGAYPGSPSPGATVTNALSFHNAVCGCPDHDIVVAPYAIPYTTRASNQTTDPKFVVATPAACSVSALTTDTMMYSNPKTRMLNPNFGQVSGLALQLGSRAIDAGTWVAGVHCDRADDAPTPYPADDPNCLHWRGAAPDIGAYEHGIKVTSPAVPGANMR